MHKKVQRKEVDILIDGKNSPQKGKVIVESQRLSPTKLSPAPIASTSSGKRSGDADFNLPSVQDLASRYGVSVLDEDEQSLRNSEQASNAEQQQQLQLNKDLAAAVQALQQKLTEKNRKIEELCVLLEAVETTSSTSTNELNRLQSTQQQLTTQSGDEIDLRDAKIVSLAKKAHTLTMTVNKEKARADRLNNELEAQKKIVDSLNSEIQELKTAINNNNNNNNNTKVYNRHSITDSKIRENDENSRREKDKQLTNALRTAEEVREKLRCAEDANKRLSRALEKELGESTGIHVSDIASGAVAVDQSGWRGRGQQIVMLKAKASVCM